MADASSPFTQPGPQGYPVRFAVRKAMWNDLKIYGANPKRPLRFIEKRGHLRILHFGGHRRENSPALVTIEENWPPRAPAPPNEVETFTITVHTNNFSPTLHGGVATYSMDHTRCRPTTYQFAMPIQSPVTGADVIEIFEWRRAPTCHETRGICKRNLPAVRTGDARPPEDRYTYADMDGYVLVRLTGPNQLPAGQQSGNRPLGHTRRGEEIVASWAQAKDRSPLSWPGTPLYYFQFWGSGAQAQLGEAFTHVAVLTATATYFDKCYESRRRDAPWLY
ncbi:hypothetical protein C8A03DRAFT_18844 [Achaetomium macrosporum]|uniref:Uncharacterized protein n=1 Tax=Achaetomium macrosporum TaxID=79813 RepID=A0AAN7H816_9PEZI|nr:hypothetical protein C8A03DRAFT_18844 [Achaetomium macrosporum]